MKGRKKTLVAKGMARKTYRRLAQEEVRQNLNDEEKWNQGFEEDS